MNTENEMAVEKTADDTAARAVEAERSRVTRIADICRGLDIDSADFIASGATVDQVNAAIVERMKAEKAPARVQTIADEGDKFRSAAADALAMRAGVQIDKPAPGAADLRGMSLRALATECLSMEGGVSASQLRRMSAEDVYASLSRQFFNPTAAFPAILDSAINKSIVQAYREVPTTFETWTSKGSLPDFKVSKDHEYLLGGGRFEKVAENGELTSSKPETEILPTRQLDTYGTQFSMSRQAFINDDIGFLTRVPAAYAAKAKRTINKQCYEILLSKGNVFDGKPLFHAAHGNLVVEGAAPSLETINALLVKLQAQRDPFGEVINATPRTLIVPVGFGLMVDTVLHSASVNFGGNAYTGYNPLASRGLQMVEDATLNALAGSGACPWFLVADKASAKSIQVDYLNGVETPTIRRSEVPGQLGYVWDIWLDWGVSVVDFRGIAKNNGVVVTL